MMYGVQEWVLMSASHGEIFWNENATLNDRMTMCLAQITRTTGSPSEIAQRKHVFDIFGAIPQSFQKEVRMPAFFGQVAHQSQH